MSEFLESTGCWFAASYIFDMQIGNLAALAGGLRLQTQRLAQSAANTANLETPGYEAQRIVTSSLPGGGVRGVSMPTYAPHASRVEADGSVTQLSNTDLAQERVTQLTSLRAFQANLSVLHTADSMLGELIDRTA